MIPISNVSRHVPTTSQLRQTSTEALILRQRPSNDRRSNTQRAVRRVALTSSRTEFSPEYDEYLSFCDSDSKHRYSMQEEREDGERTESGCSK